jgi:hypothetical protein
LDSEIEFPFVSATLYDQDGGGEVSTTGADIDNPDPVVSDENDNPLDVAVYIKVRSEPS